MEAFFFFGYWFRTYIYTLFGSGVWEIYIQGNCGMDSVAFIHGQEDAAKNLVRERHRCPHWLHLDT